MAVYSDVDFGSCSPSECVGTFFVKKYKVMFHNCNANCIGLDSISVKIIEVLPLKGCVVCYLECPWPSQVVDRWGCLPRGARSWHWAFLPAVSLGGAEEAGRPLAGEPNLETLRNGNCTNLPPGQSYEIRLLENRKLGDFQDLNTKYVKVSLWGAVPP